MSGNDFIHDLLGMDPYGVPCEPICSDEDCAPCAMTECGFREPLHRHHDGCPACSLLWALEDGLRALA
jgi:hypothetical protein